MAEPGNKKIFVKIKWHHQAGCLLLETIFASVLYPKREQLKLTKPWHPLEHWSRSQVISINLLQVGQPLSVFTFPALTAMMEVVRISEQNKKFVKIKLGKNNIKKGTYVFDSYLFTYPTVIFSDWYRTRRILRRTSGVTVPLKPPFLNKLSMVWILSHPGEQKKNYSKFDF